MAYRVIQWHTGSTGTQALQQVIADPASFELVGVLVHSPEKEGLDAGELAGTAPTGVRATCDKAALLQLDADVVLHNSRWIGDLDELDADVVALLESGKDVITVVSGYMCPWVFGEDRARRLHDACVRGSSTLFGTGLAHGLTDWLAVVLTGVSASVQEIRYTERYDRRDSARPYAILEVMGMGKPASELTVDSPRGTQYFRKFEESAAVMAACLATTVRGVTHDVEVALAPEDLEIAAGTVARGTVCGVRWSIRAQLEAGPDLVLVGQRSVASVPGWDTSTGWTIEVEGDPSARVDLHLAPSVLGTRRDDLVADSNLSEIRATAAAQIRAIPEVVPAPPGVMLPRVFATWSDGLRRPAPMWVPAT
jgi:hypothetical protein